MLTDNQIAAVRGMRPFISYAAIATAYGVPVHYIRRLCR